MDKAPGQKNDKLPKKVLDGKANADEKKGPLDLYAGQGKNKPPQGDAKSRKDKTTALTAAAKEAVGGKGTGVAGLKEASSCAACHKAHTED
jgi:hypothetical protein